MGRSTRETTRLRAGGKTTLKRLPSPGALHTTIAAPWARTIPARAARPKPRPGNLVEKNGSKIFCRVSGSIPTPVSLTSKNTQFPLGTSPIIRLGSSEEKFVPIIPVESVMVPHLLTTASDALVNRFITIWRTWEGSASIGGRLGTRSKDSSVPFEIET